MCLKIAKALPLCEKAISMELVFGAKTIVVHCIRTCPLSILIST